MELETRGTKDETRGHILNFAKQKIKFCYVCFAKFFGHR